MRHRFDLVTNEQIVGVWEAADRGKEARVWAS